MTDTIKRRTRVAAIFPSEESLLRLVTALLAEQSDEWATEVDPEIRARG